MYVSRGPRQCATPHATPPQVTASGTRFLLGQNPNLLTYNNPNDFQDMRDVIMRGADADGA